MFDNLPSIFGSFYSIFGLLHVFGNFVFNFMFSTFSENLVVLSDTIPLLSNTNFANYMNQFYDLIGISNIYPIDLFFSSFVVVVACLCFARFVLDIIV